jgi:DNA repair photolyase
MKVIYEPSGKAREFAPLAANLYEGCGHGCLYCYVPKIFFKNVEAFARNPKPRENVLKWLEADARKFAGDERQVLFSFTSDPYQPVNDKHKLTREAIRILNSYDIGLIILTKGGLRPVKDFDLLAKSPKNSFAITLTNDNPEASRYWEPGAALPKERIAGLKAAHDAGIKTWVSLEPVVDPIQSLNLIKMTAEVADFYKVGKLNYHSRSKEIDWRKYRKDVVALLKKLKKPFYMKEDLKNI